MPMINGAARKLKEWVRSRPPLDVEESATWFLLLFIYAQGLTADGLGFRWSGIVPELTVPQLSLAMVVMCLAASVIVLIEPLLPSQLRERTICARRSGPGQHFRRLSVWFAFTFGLLAGFGILVDKAPTLSWLIGPVFYVGFVIFIVMGIKMVVLAGRDGMSARRQAS